MKDFQVSHAEKQSLLQSFIEGRRFDGRLFDQFRRVSITLGQNRGSCLVQLGNTKTLACTSCEVTEPKPGRPTEGNIYINVEVSPMSAPIYDAGRGGSFLNEVTRILERCIKEARCVDTESLCIVAGEKVWEIRLDVHLLDIDGSVTDAAQLAAVTALRHFRRPDVTVIGEEVTIHSLQEKEPVALNVYHLPVCLTIGYSQGCLVVDPTDREERVLDGKVVLGLNSHREICTLHCTGDMLLKKKEVLRCVNLGAKRVEYVTNLIKSTIAEDAERRSKKMDIGFHLHIAIDKVTGLFKDAIEQSDVKVEPVKTEPPPPEPEFVGHALDSSLIGKGRKPVKIVGNIDAGDGVEILANDSLKKEAETSPNENAEMEIEIVKETKKKKRKKRPVVKNEVDSLLDDIDADVVMLKEGDQL